MANSNVVKDNYGWINIFLWISILIFFSPILVILWLYQNVLQILVTQILKRNNFRLPNHITDALFCQGTSCEMPNVNAAQIWFVAGKWVSCAEFSQHFYKCFLQGNPEKYRNLYAHVTTFGGYGFYSHCKAEDLDLGWHIRQYSLHDFGNGSLENWAASWMTTNTYEESRPPWQIAILHFENESDNTMETCIVAKFSHALVDGYSFVHMVEKLTDNPAPYLVKGRRLTFMEKLKHLYKAPKDILSLYRDLSFTKNTQTPFKKDCRSWPKTSLSWNMSFVTLDLNTIRLLRKATDTHFICLIISAQYGALRKLLLETMSESELPEYLWISSSLPWPEHPLKLTNHWSLGYFKCPLRLSDPMDRLREIESYYRFFMAKEYDIKGMLLVAPLMRLLPAFAKRLFYLYDFGIANVSLFSASLLLSSKQHYLLGRPVKNLYLPLALPDAAPIVLYTVTTSHCDQIDVSICASSPVVRNQDELDRLTQIYFVEELHEIASRFGVSCREN